MTPKEKAEELIEKFYKQLTKDFEKNYYAQIIANKMRYNDAKQCVLIAVDELIKEQTMWQNGEVNPVLYW
jgi:hypothetical protein